MMQMEGVLPWLLGFAMFATLVVLVGGVVSFGVHGHFYQRHSNNLMRLRVVLQGIAVAIFALITFFAVK